MCTLIVGFQQHNSIPLWVAANRDEVRSRAAVAPSWWPHETFFAPRDLQGGGTWLGLTTSGLFVGVTNRFPSERHLDRQSRGTLVVEALRARSASQIHERLSTLEAGRFNTFHLLYADATAAFVTWSDGTTIHHDTLQPGVHVVTERSLGGDDRGRTALIEGLVPTLPQHLPGVPTSESLQRLLGTRDDAEPARGVCVDLPQFDYGSRSAVVCFLTSKRSETKWWWAEGRPDRTPFVEDVRVASALDP